MSIGHVYNSNATDENNGWRLNYNQTIKIPLDTADIKTYPYVYTDEDGTEHYFQKSKVTYLQNGASKTVETDSAIPPAQDEDGLKLYIVPVTEKSLKEKYPLKLVDKSSSVVKYFDRMGRLAMITDSNQYENAKNSNTKEKNCVTINYESCGDDVSFAAYDEAKNLAQTFRDICYKAGVTSASKEYTDARDNVLDALNTLKKDVYATADYAIAKQVNAASVEMANLTDTTNAPAKATIKTKSDAILAALKKAKPDEEAIKKWAGESSKRISSVTDAVGNEAKFTYDEAGRLSTISDPTYKEERL